MGRLWFGKEIVKGRLKSLLNAPPFFLSVISFVYLVLGSLSFLYLDEKLYELHFHEVFFFSYTTLTTIGYGDIVPSNLVTKVFCTMFILFGTPLLFSAFSRWNIVIIKVYNSNRPTCHDDQLPLFMVIVSLLAYSLFAGVMYSSWLQTPSMITSFYFGFVSITTIGYGDFYLHPQSTAGTIALIFIHSVGICLMSTLISHVCSTLKRINYIGRDIWSTSSRESTIWINGAKFTLKELLEGVTSYYDGSPQKLKNIISELDSILDMDSHDPNNNTGNDQNNTYYESVFSSLDEHQNLLHAFATVINLSRSGQKSIRKSDPSLRELLQLNTPVDV